MIVNSVEKENTQMIMVPGIIPFNMQGLIFDSIFLKMVILWLDFQNCICCF